jgi:hypothetical protein
MRVAPKIIEVVREIFDDRKLFFELESQTNNRPSSSEGCYGGVKQIERQIDQEVQRRTTDPS